MNPTNQVIWQELQRPSERKRGEKTMEGCDAEMDLMDNTHVDSVRVAGILNDAGVIFIIVIVWRWNCPRQLFYSIFSGQSNLAGFYRTHFYYYIYYYRQWRLMPWVSRMSYTLLINWCYTCVSQHWAFCEEKLREIQGLWRFFCTTHKVLR